MWAAEDDYLVVEAAVVRENCGGFVGCMTIIESQAAQRHPAGGQALRRKSVAKVQTTDEYLYDAEGAEARGKAVPRVRETSADASA